MVATFCSGRDPAEDVFPETPPTQPTRRERTICPSGSHLGASPRGRQGYCPTHVKLTPRLDRCPGREDPQPASFRPGLCRLSGSSRCRARSPRSPSERLPAGRFRPPGEPGPPGGGAPHCASHLDGRNPAAGPPQAFRSAGPPGGAPHYASHLDERNPASGPRQASRSAGPTGGGAPQYVLHLDGWRAAARGHHLTSGRAPSRGRERGPLLRPGCRCGPDRGPASRPASRGRPGESGEPARSGAGP